MPTEATARAPRTALVRTVALRKQYVQRGMFGRGRFVVEALQGVDLDIPTGCLTALVGGSGSGKSTLARCLAMLEKPDSGEIWFGGESVSSGTAQQLVSLCPKIQLVFQDSAGALNPRFSAAQIIAEPLEIQHREKGRRLHERALELMEEVGLSPDWADRRPLEFSGGQRQRLAIARAIALRPALLILDESLSGLDLSTQAQILNLLLDLRSTQALTYLLISHDLRLVGQIADVVAIMQQGEVVERGPTQQVLSRPKHPHTQALAESSNSMETAFLNGDSGQPNEAAHD